MRSRATLETALIAVGFVVVAFFLPHILAGDDDTRVNDIDQVLRVGHLTASKYSLVMPLASAPFVALSYAHIGTLEGWASHFNVIVVALGVATVFGLLRRRVDNDVLRKFALVLLFASLMTNRLRDYNAEVFSATLITVGLIAVVTDQRPWLGWAAIVLAVVNTPAAFLGLVLVGVAWSVSTKRFRPLAAVIAAGALIMAEAWIRRGGPLTSGYESDYNNPSVLPYSHHAGFSYPIVLGIAATLFSFGRGLVFYTPGLVLAFSRRTWELVNERLLAVLMFLFLGGLILAYAHWWAWYAGLTWGPRFYPLAAILASLLIAFRLHDRRPTPLHAAFTLAILTLSAWVTVTGGLNDFSQEYFCEQRNNTLGYLCWDTPEFSSLWWPVRHFPHLTLRTDVFVGYCGLVWAYLALPLLARALGGVAPLWRDRSWAHGWRI